jgi:TPR repeat protein
MSAVRIIAALFALICTAALLHGAGAAELTTQTAKRAPTDYDAEIAKLRPLVGNPATHDEAMKRLGDLAVRAANDLEVALALGDTEKVEALDRLIREKLGDTRWRVEQRAEQGDADALVALGMFQARNLLAARDKASACSLFILAAEHKSVAGTYQAALCLLPSDPERSAAWMQRAADAGHPAAEEAVGRACLENKPEPRLDCAVRYVTEAAQAGRPSALSLLGWMTANGAGVAKDPRRAAQLYLEAARKYDAAAQNNLGELYENGTGVSKNLHLAAGWYRKAAETNFAPAQFNLGRIYALGIGVKKDPAMAREWLEKAKAHGVPQADEVLRWLDSQAVQAGGGGKR